MNAYTAEQITLAQEIVAGQHLNKMSLRPIATALGITDLPTPSNRTHILGRIKEVAQQIALLAPVDAEEVAEEAAPAPVEEVAEEAAPAPVEVVAPPRIKRKMPTFVSAPAPVEEAPTTTESAPVELSPAEFAWESAYTTEADRKAEFIRLHEENERLTALVRTLQAIPRASPITPSAAPAPKAKAVKAVKAAKEPKEKAKPTARISTKGANLSEMLEEGESVFSKELINEGENKGQYRICEGRWLGAKGFGLVIDGELSGEGIKSPTTLVSAFRQMMNSLGESKQSSSTTCGFAKCFVVREGKEVRLISLIPQPTTE
jgi:hypothetical protein